MAEMARLAGVVTFADGTASVPPPARPPGSAPAAARAESASPVGKYEVIHANTGSSTKIGAVRVDVV
jgi:hypothetical protein